MSARIISISAIQLPIVLPLWSNSGRVWIKFTLPPGDLQLTKKGQYERELRRSERIRGDERMKKRGKLLHSPRSNKEQLLEKMGDGLALAYQFLFCLRHHLSAEITYFKSFDDFPLTVLGGDWKGVHDILINSIRIAG